MISATFGHVEKSHEPLIVVEIAKLLFRWSPGPARHHSSRAGPQEISNPIKSAAIPAGIAFSVLNCWITTLINVCQYSAQRTAISRDVADCQGA
jgi:hypothetical protein